MARRLYKTKEERLENPILDDRHELFSCYSSKCARCVHFEEWDFFCVAFPEGIPDEYLSGEAVHDKVDSRQVGDTVFTERT